MTKLLTLQLSNLPLSDFTLIKGKENDIMSITLENIYLTEFSNFELPDLVELVFIDNLRLQTFELNVLPNLTEFSIVGKSALRKVFNNTFSNLEKLAFINSTDTKIVLDDMVKGWITGLYLINNNITEFDFTDYENLAVLGIMQNPIVSLNLTNHKKLR